MDNPTPSSGSLESIQELQRFYDAALISNTDIQKEIDFWSHANLQTDTSNSPDFSINQEVKISNPFVFNAKKPLASLAPNSQKVQPSLDHAPNSNVGNYVNNLFGLNNNHAKNPTHASQTEHGYNLSNGTNHPLLPSFQEPLNTPISTYTQTSHNLPLSLNSFSDSQNKAAALNPTGATEVLRLEALKILQNLLSSQPAPHTLNPQNPPYVPKEIPSTNQYHNQTLESILNSNYAVPTNSVLSQQPQNLEQRQNTTAMKANHQTQSHNIMSSTRNSIDSTFTGNKGGPVLRVSEPLLLNSPENSDSKSVSRAPEKKKRTPSEEDKRRRNTAASARFRVKKKLKEKVLEQKNFDLEKTLEALRNRVQELELENKWLRNIVTEKDPKAFNQKGCPCHHPDGFDASDH
ncbi:hypothetical protein BB560_003500 [Smittium megazygosporum]|uniref:BZIP domain-containing protein n=1 Tax=Smittium megazygosporum TaxID=133381 RepID=A0A2T9ZBZ5_9FUNG|nr:hypothetical protein BB560_003500 [Smittium megazygosporum]